MRLDNLNLENLTLEKIELTITINEGKLEYHRLMIKYKSRLDTLGGGPNQTEIEELTELESKITVQELELRLIDIKLQYLRDKNGN